MNKIKFLHCDHWILMTIPINKDGVDLEGIIGRADAINHAIPTDEEIEGAITRCLQANIIKKIDDKYVFTDNYLKIFDKLWEKSKNVFDMWKIVEEYLSKSDLKKMNSDELKLKLNESSIAHKKYSETFWKMYKEIDQNKK